MLDTIDAERKALIAQVIRYGLAGVGVTLFQSLLYWLGVYPLHLAPLVSHCIASAFAVVVGHQVHARFSFRGHGSGEEPTFLRFAAVALFGIALNALWVWLLTSPLGLPDWTPILAYLIVTPAIVFLLNRIWVFR